MPALTSCTHFERRSSRAVIGFSGEEERRPWSIQCWMRSRLRGAYSFRVLSGCKRLVRIANRMLWGTRDGQICESTLWKTASDRRLATFETGFWFAVTSACLLALVTSSGGSASTRALAATETLCLVKNERVSEGSSEAANSEAAQMANGKLTAWRAPSAGFRSAIVTIRFAISLAALKPETA